MYKCRSAFNSIIYLRYADILLLKAEAKIMGEAPDLNGAADIIDRIRNRAGLGKLPQSTRSSKEALLQAIWTNAAWSLPLKDSAGTTFAASIR